MICDRKKRNRLNKKDVEPNLELRGKSWVVNRIHGNGNIAAGGKHCSFTNHHKCEDYMTSGRKCKCFGEILYVTSIYVMVQEKVNFHKIR